ncbi:unnamed protein product [Rhizoctonia solani]|uniref:Ribosomal RNA methyltransferase FtsJ domain-containing protein n=1 Tax=Rhizoctonia solani TaxID=456999 RepID=A0A8H3AJK7_9AGAM|nr:unnamed protein product [Rhizoctonia solani]
MTRFAPDSESPFLATVDVDPRAQWLREDLMEREDRETIRRLDEIPAVGRSSPEADNYSDGQRSNADRVMQKHIDIDWAKAMYDSLRYMDLANNRFVRTERFLDIGCNPGGYSTYILRACPSSSGMGITLPVEDSGHGCVIPSALRPRIDIREIDLTLIDLGPNLPTLDVSRITRRHALALHLVPLPFRRHEFDLVVCDAHRSRLHPDNDISTRNRNRLLISQVLLALRAVNGGGTIFLGLSCTEPALSARILIAFTRIAESTRSLTPRLLHASRGSFYLLARDIRVGTPAYRRFVAGLEGLWHNMAFSGARGLGRDVTWAEQNLITAWDEVMAPVGVDHISRLGRPMWEVQHGALLKPLTELRLNSSYNKRPACSSIYIDICLFGIILSACTICLCAASPSYGSLFKLC